MIPDIDIWRAALLVNLTVKTPRHRRPSSSMVRYGSNSDNQVASAMVRFTSESGRPEMARVCLRDTISRQ